MLIFKLNSTVSAEMLQAVSHCAFSDLKVQIHVKLADVSSYSMHLTVSIDSTLSFLLVKISSPCACVALPIS